MISHIISNHPFFVFALSIQASVTQTDVFDTLKLAALVIDFDSLQEFSLRFPLSRITRDHSKIDVTEALDRFNGRIQDEYNDIAWAKPGSALAWLLFHYDEELS